MADNKQNTVDNTVEVAPAPAAAAPAPAQPAG